VARKQDKQAIVKDLANKLSSAASAILTDYRGLNVQDITELRRKLREAGVEYRVAKNTLTILAAREAGLDDLEEYLAGPTAIAFSYDDPAVPAKELNEFAKANQNLEIKGAVVEGKVVGQDVVKRLADLPSREQLLAQVAGAFTAPLAGLVNVLVAPMRGFATAVDAIRQQREATN